MLRTFLNAGIKDLIAVALLVTTVIQVFLLGAHSFNAYAKDQPQLVRVHKVTQTTTQLNGAQLPAYPKGQPQITILRYEIAPNGTLPLHKHSTITAGFIVRGDLKVTTESGEEFTFHPNESIVELVNQWHSGKNVGDGQLEVIVFYAGIEGDTTKTLYLTPQ